MFSGMTLKWQSHTTTGKSIFSTPSFAVQSKRIFLLTSHAFILLPLSIPVCGDIKPCAISKPRWFNVWPLIVITDYGSLNTNTFSFISWPHCVLVQDNMSEIYNVVLTTFVWKQDHNVFPLCAQSNFSVCPALCSPISALLCFSTWQLSKHRMWLRHGPGSMRGSGLDPNVVFQYKDLHSFNTEIGRPSGAGG